MSDDVRQDVIGVDIQVGDMVAAAKSNDMLVCEVVRLCPKKIRVKEVGEHGYEWTCYPHNTAVLSNDSVMAYRLRGDQRSI